MIVVAILMLLDAPLSAQVISGNVTDKRAHEPLPGVAIRLMDAKMQVIDSVLSDTLGRFKFAIGQHKCSVHLSHDGYNGTLYSNLGIASDTLMFFQMQKECPYTGSKYAPICPVCHSIDSVIPIYYGLIKFKLDKRGKPDGIGEKFLWGGCEVSPCDPHWYCKKDSKEL